MSTPNVIWNSFDILLNKYVCLHVLYWKYISVQCKYTLLMLTLLQNTGGKTGDILKNDMNVQGRHFIPFQITSQPHKI